MTLWEYAMTKLDEYRKKFPQYNDLSDGQLAYGIYNKTYRDLPLVQFAKQLGFNKTQTLDFLKVAGQKGDAVRFENQTSANVGNNPTGALRSFFQGMTFGGGDEVVAAGTAGAKSLLGQGAGSFSDMYEQELQKERSRLGQFRETNPKTAIASELVGGAVVPLGTAKNVKQGVGLGLGLAGVPIIPSAMIFDAQRKSYDDYIKRFNNIQTSSTVLARNVASNNQVDASNNNRSTAVADQTAMSGDDEARIRNRSAYSGLTGAEQDARRFLDATGRRITGSMN